MFDKVQESLKKSKDERQKKHLEKERVQMFSRIFAPRKKNLKILKNFFEKQVKKISLFQKI